MESEYNERDFADESERNYVSSDSETDGDELGDDEYEDIRKSIRPILNLGQTLAALWPISLIDHAGDIITTEETLTDSGFPEGESLSKSLDWPRGSMQDNFFEPKHRRAPSLPCQGKLEQIKLELDEIYVTPDEEYGFNPMRLKCRSRKIGRRSVSLYAPDQNPDLLVNFDSSDVSYVLSCNNLKDEVSHARNEEEAKIEEDIACLRAQPSNVEFNRKNDAKKHFQELIRGIATRRSIGVARSLRRKLSFDSHPRRRTLSDADRQKSDPGEPSEGGAYQFPFDSSQESLTDPQLDFAKPGTSPEYTLEDDDIRLAAPPILSNKRMVEVLVSANPADKGKKRRTTIPQFLNALKLPNKKAIKRFMRKKSERPLGTMQPKIPRPFPIERAPSDSALNADTIEQEKTSCPGSPSVNTFAKPNSQGKKTIIKDARKRSQSLTASVKKNSCSMCSLPKVEEGIEISEFDGTLNRKSCSTCSIVVAKFLGNAKEQPSVLERRMSDTALAFKDDRQPSCSPGRRFILKLLSPVVCGLNHDKYVNFQSSESYSSLNSCHSDVSAEADLLSQKLTDFNVQDIAEELALIDKELLIRITWQELANCGWMSINKYVTSPNVMNMVEFFNRVAMLVATSILVEETAYLRAKAISKMIKLAAKCRQFKNYDALKAVLGGLQCTPIYRLETSWKHVRARRKRLFGELSSLMSESDNFSAYRAELTRSVNDPPCIPFLGDFLTQITQTQAYFAMRRRKTLAKQRLEKAVIADNSDKNAKAEEKDKPKQDEASVDEALCSASAKESGEEDTMSCSDRRNTINEKVTEEETVEKAVVTEKLNTADTQASDADEVDQGEKFIDTKENGHVNSSDVPGEGIGEKRPLSLSFERGTSDEDAGQLDKFERESIRRSVANITNAMFQTGSKYNASRNDDEFLEALNEYLENPEVPEVPVFSDTEPVETSPVARDKKCSYVQNNKSSILQESDHNDGHLTDLSDLCTYEDHGVGSTSSYDLSPTAYPVPIMPTNSESEKTPVSSATHMSARNDLVVKKTHARNDSNDSGVVIQNGRSSRASEDLNASRENLCAPVSEENDNPSFEDSKHCDDNDLNEEPEANNVDGRVFKALPVLETDISETRKLEERIRSEKPQGEETKFNKKELQFWQYQIAAMKYQLSSRLFMRKFLLNACYNSEDENYSLSLKREPIHKK